MKSLKRYAVLLFLLSAALATAESKSTPTFHFIQYPKATGTALFGVSNNEAAVGIYFDTSGNQHGFMVTSSGKFTTIDNPNGTTYLEGVNSSGTIVGYYIDTSNNYFAFQYTNGIFTDLGPSGGSQTLAYGINDDGVISGEYLDSATGLDEGWVLNNGTYETLFGPLSGEPALAVDTNINGITTVEWEGSTGDVESSIYNGTTYTTENVPGATNSYIHRIDAAGDLVYSWQDSSGTFHGAALVAGKFTKFDAPGCSQTYGDGINDHQIIVGVCEKSNGTNIGFYVTY
jgi:probable HAF family extracellular repeat protein